MPIRWRPEAQAPSEPIVLDPTGTDIHGESARMREHGSVTSVELPGGVRGAISGTAALRTILTSPLVSRNPHLHRPAFVNGTIGLCSPRPHRRASPHTAAITEALPRAPAFTDRRIAGRLTWTVVVVSYCVLGEGCSGSSSGSGCVVEHRRTADRISSLRAGGWWDRSDRRSCGVGRDRVRAEQLVCVGSCRRCSG